VVERVIVVGAGVAGLRCAQVLEAHGVDVEIFERADRVGGRVATDVIDGFRIDRGFQLLNPSYPQARRALDLKALDLHSFAPGMVVSDGETRFSVADPLRRPRALVSGLTAPLGSLPSRVRLGRLLFELKTSMRRVQSVGEEPSGNWFKECGISQEAIDAVLRPFLAGVLLEERLETSAWITALLLRSFVRGVPGVPAEGMGAIPLQMASSLTKSTVHLSTPVASGGAHGIVLDDGTRCEGDAVVDATPWGVGSSPTRHDRSTTTWWYVTDAPLASKDTLVVDRAGGVLTNSVEMTAAAPSYAPEGKVLVAASAIGLHPSVERERAARERLAALHRTSTKDWELVSMSLVEHALPNCSAPFAKDQPIEIDGIVRAGDHVATPSIQGAMASGERAARLLLQRS
jgi:Flavin containing amine oxidoreductase